jgi:hypothetical protein
MPENTKALAFWRKTITNAVNAKFKEEIRDIDYDKDQPKRVIFSFTSSEVLN